MLQYNFLFRTYSIFYLFKICFLENISYVCTRITDKNEGNLYKLVLVVKKISPENVKLSAICI